MANDVELTLKLTAGSLGQALKELTDILASQTTTGSSEESLQVVKEHIEGIKRRDISRIAATVADSFALESDTLPTYGFSSRTTDRQGYMQLWQQLWNSFPDTEYVMEREPFAVGDLVMYLWRGAGTHQEMWAGVEGTGRQLDVHGCSIFQVRNGKIVADYEFFDTGKLLQLMGAVTVPGSFYSGAPASGSTPASGSPQPQYDKSSDYDRLKYSEVLNKMKQLEDALVQFANRLAAILILKKIR